MSIDLVVYEAPRDDGGPHAAFRAEVAEHTRLDPRPALRGVAELTGIPVGALARYMLVRWATEGSDALLALGPRAVERLWATIESTESEGTDAARLAAWASVCGQLSWLRAGVEAGGGTESVSPPGVAPRSP